MVKPTRALQQCPVWGRRAQRQLPALCWAAGVEPGSEGRLSWRGVSQGQVTQHPLHPCSSLQPLLRLSLRLHMVLGVLGSRQGATGSPSHDCRVWEKRNRCKQSAAKPAAARREPARNLEAHSSRDDRGGAGSWAWSAKKPNVLPFVLVSLPLCRAVAACLAFE